MNPHNLEQQMKDVRELSKLLEIGRNKFSLDTPLYSMGELVEFINSLDDEQLKKMLQLIAFCCMSLKIKSTESPDSL